MLVAIPVMQDVKQASIEPRLGRTPFFALWNLDDDSCSFIDNSINLNSMQGAGIQVAQLLIDHKVNAVLTANCGPKAFALLSAEGIDVYLGIKGSLIDAVNMLRNSQLTKATTANVEGHW